MVANVAVGLNDAAERRQSIGHDDAQRTALACEIDRFVSHVFAVEQDRLDGPSLGNALHRAASRAADASKMEVGVAAATSHLHSRAGTGGTQGHMQTGRQRSRDTSIGHESSTQPTTSPGAQRESRHAFAGNATCIDAVSGSRFNICSRRAAFGTEKLQTPALRRRRSASPSTASVAVAKNPASN